jgi:hypothetical protein
MWQAGDSRRSTTVAGIPMTMAVRQWAARGGPIILGRVVPAVVACIGLGAVTASIVSVQHYGWRDASASSGFFMAIALLAAWLFWRFLRTVWLVMLANDTFTCLATGARWTLGPGEIVAVRGDVYHQFLQIVGPKVKISVWGQLNDRDSLFAAIRRANPMVEFAPWIQPTND